MHLNQIVKLPPTRATMVAMIQQLEAAVLEFVEQGNLPVAQSLTARIRKLQQQVREA